MRSAERGFYAAFFLAVATAGAVSAQARGAQQAKPPASQPRGPSQGPAPGPGPAPQAKMTPTEAYTIEQSVSEKAQLSTIAFSALAFMTGTFGADTFLPPGKVADYFGFQYMRDIDAAEAGHNMMFLTNIGNNVLSILGDSQKASLLALAKEQEPLYEKLARMRLVLIKAFRENMEGAGKAGTGLSQTAVEGYVAEIFAVDGRLAAGRARVYGEMVRGLTASQKAALAALKFGDSSTWPPLPEQYDKRTMSHGQDVLFMTYASEFFSWYAGSETADVYFCPERHGTYFGGFYMKDYPAVGNQDYFIPTALTGDSGEAFLAALTAEQRAKIEALMTPLPAILAEILTTRKAISAEFRKYLAGGTADEGAAMALSRRYGELDGRISFLMAQAFAEVYKTLSPAQKAAMVKLRNQAVFPEGYYLYADPVAGAPAIETAFLKAK